MEIIVSGRHLPVSEELKAYAESKLGKLDILHAKLTHARVILDHEKIEQKAEVTLSGKNVNLVARAESEDMYASIDQAIEKLEKQLRKHMEKLHEHHGEQKLRDLDPDGA